MGAAAALEELDSTDQAYWCCSDDAEDWRVQQEYLVELDRDDERYLGFFEWRATHRILSHEEVGEEALCALCAAAHKGAGAEGLPPRATPAFLSGWRDAAEHCRRPPWTPSPRAR